MARADAASGPCRWSQVSVGRQKTHSLPESACGEFECQRDAVEIRDQFAHVLPVLDPDPSTSGPLLQQGDCGVGWQWGNLENPLTGTADPLAGRDEHAETGGTRLPAVHRLAACGRVDEPIQQQDHVAAVRKRVTQLVFPACGRLRVEWNPECAPDGNEDVRLVLCGRYIDVAGARRPLARDATRHAGLADSGGAAKRRQSRLGETHARGRDLHLASVQGRRWGEHTSSQRRARCISQSQALGEPRALRTQRRERGSECSGAWPALIGFVRGRAFEDLGQSRRQGTGQERCGGQGRIGRFREEQRVEGGVAVALVGLAQPVEGPRQGVQIRPGVDGAAGVLLGCHVRGGSGHPSVPGKAPRTGNAEVAELHGCAIEQEVLRLDVPVHQGQCLVGILERRTDLHADLHERPGRERPVGCKRPPRTEFHRAPGMPVRGAQFVDVDDVPMAELPGDAGLVVERVGAGLHLQCHGPTAAVRQCLVGCKDRAERTAPQLASEGEPVDVGGGSQHGRSIALACPRSSVGVP